MHDVLPESQPRAAARRSWRWLAILAVLTMGLAACGDGEAGPGDEDGALDGLTGTTAPDVPDVEDDAVEDDNPLSADTLPDDFPDYIPLPDDYEVTEAIGNADVGFTVYLEVAAPAQEVADFYESALPDAGWTGVERNDVDAEATGTEDLYEIEAEHDEHDDAIRLQIQGDEPPSEITMFTGGPPS